MPPAAAYAVAPSSADIAAAHGACVRKDVLALRTLLERTATSAANTTNTHTAHAPVPSWDVTLPRGLPGVAEGDTLLTYAIKDAHPANAELADVLLQHGACPERPKGRALRWAALSRQPDVVRVLLQHGAGRDSRSRDGRTALHFAAIGVCERSTRVLLEAGADATAADNGRNTALHLLPKATDVEHMASEAEQLVRMLLQHGAGLTAKDQHGWTPLHVTACYATPQLTRLLMRLGQKAGLGAKVCDGGLTALHYASGGLALLNPPVPGQARGPERAAVVQALLELDPRPPVHVRVGPKGEMPLHMACTEGNREIVALLLTHGSDPLKANGAGELPLHAACVSKDPNAWMAIEPLVAAGGKGMLSARADVATALALAVEYNTAAARELLRLGAPPNQGLGPGGGTTVLHLVCSKMPKGFMDPSRSHPGDAALQGALNQLMDGREPQARTAGSLPASDGSLAERKRKQTEMVELLLAHGANPNIRDKASAPGLPGNQRVTPLDMAAMCGNSHLLPALVRAGGDPTANPDCMVIKGVAATGDTEALKALLQSPHVDVNALLPPTGTLLHDAVAHGQVGSVEVLLAAGADARLRWEGRTPLQLLEASDQAAASRLIKARIQRLLRGAPKPPPSARSGNNNINNSPKASAGASGSSAASPPSPSDSTSTIGSGSGGSSSKPGPSYSDKACSHCGAMEGSGAGQPVTLKRCTRCRAARYCSEACQKADWKGSHKHFCKFIAEEEARIQPIVAEMAKKAGLP